MNFTEILVPQEAVIIRKKSFVQHLLLLGFILGTFKGRIALWVDGNAEPLHIFPNSVASLPPADQLALEKGIPIESRDELLHLLEDYLS